MNCIRRERVSRQPHKNENDNQINECKKQFTKSELNIFSNKKSEVSSTVTPRFFLYER